ncbi:MAG: hypothetical protein V4648_05470 [Bacteroidota bacterium]
MKKILSLIILFFTVNGIAQTGAHTPTTKVIRAFMSKDESKMLTYSGTELVLWDNNNNTPIWVKKLTELGFTNEIIYEPIISVDPYMKYFLITDKQSYRRLINLTNFQMSPWDYYTYDFMQDGRIAVLDYDYSKKNSHKAYLLNIDNGQRELIAENIGDISVVRGGTKIQIRFHGKSVNDYSDKVKVYDLATKKTEKSELMEFRYDDKNLKSGNYTVEYNYGDKTIKTSDANSKQIASFTVQNPVTGSMESNKTHMFYLSETNPVVYFLEQANKPYPNNNLSYVYAYDITNGNVIKKVELHNTSDKAKQSADNEKKKHEEVMAEKQRIFNLPENVKKRKIDEFQGKYVYNTYTKMIYYVVPNMPIYDGDLIRMDEIHDRKQRNRQVYDKLTSLENNYFFVVNGFKTCTACDGKGYHESSGQRTVADYEYTTGKKLVETTYNKSGCSECGGGGLIRK